MPAQTKPLGTVGPEDRVCPKCRTHNELAALERRQYRCVGCGLELAHIDMAANGAVRGVFGWVLGLGTVVNERYQVTAVLGKGGFGVTYLVDDIRLAGKRRALKEIPGLLFDEYETRLLGRLNHPAIPDIIDRFAVDAMVYLVLEFGGSRTLRIEMDRQGGRIPVFLLLPWIEQVCAALVYLHSQDPPVIHRDLKPENILLDENERVMLIDFGIAKESNEQNMTRTLGRAVSNGFSPPEQVLGTGTDVRSDVYALGAILYCAITGRVPPAAHERITGTVLEPPSKFFPEIPPLLDSAICQALELNLHKRQQTMAEFSHCLALVQAGSASPRTVVATDPAALMAGLSPRDVSLASVQLPSMRRSQRPVTSPSGTEQSPAGPGPAARRPSWGWVGTGVVGALLVVGAAWLYWRSPAQTSAENTTASTGDPISMTPARPTTTPGTGMPPAVALTNAPPPPVSSTISATPTSNEKPATDAREVPDALAAVPQVRTPAPTNLESPAQSAEGQAAAGPDGLSSPPNELTEQALELSSAQRRQVQAWLTGLNLNPGPLDGEFGWATREALRSWQRSAALPASGFLDRAQLERLGQEGDATQAQRIYWESIQSSGSAPALTDFVSLYPTGQYASLARARITALREAEQQVRLQAEQRARRQAEQQTRPAPSAPASPPRVPDKPKQQPRKQVDTAQRKPEPPHPAPSQSGSSRYTPEQIRALKRFNEM
jgi:serine/threonine-protein kinase